MYSNISILLMTPVHWPSSSDNLTKFHVVDISTNPANTWTDKSWTEFPKVGGGNKMGGGVVEKGQKRAEFAIQCLYLIIEEQTLYPNYKPNAYWFRWIVQASMFIFCQ